MKRGLPGDVDDKKMKKVKLENDEAEGGLDRRETANSGGPLYLDDNVLFEVLKHVDARSLARAACVSKQWNKTAQDERLWELICTRHWANIGCGNQQLRSVVLALGGFRRLHSLYIWPLSRPQSSSSGSSSSPSPWAPLQSMISSKPATGTRLGKDEVHLSLSLLSIRYYEKMNFNNRTR